MLTSKITDMDFSRTEAVAARLELVAQSASTNDDVRAHASDVAGWPHLSVLLTRNQTAGRGRLDRTWVTPPGAALAISVLLRDLPSAPDAFGWIPLIAGAAMTDAVSAQLVSRTVGLKWPNDVLVDGKKICGILAESTGTAVIVGAGVNTAMTREQLPVSTATSFAVLGTAVDEDQLVADYLRALDELLRPLAAADDAGVSGVHEMVSQRCLTIGQDVNVTMPDGSVLNGRAVRLEVDGRLRVHADGREHLIAAGDVVHARLS